MSHLASWKRKFANAFRGIHLGIEGQNSFLVHLPCALIVVVLAGLLRCSLVEWGILLLCIGCVLAAELFNSSLEWLAKGVCKEENCEVGRALDIASGAVLVVSVFAAIVGAIVLGARVFSTLFAEAPGIR